MSRRIEKVKGTKVSHDGFCWWLEKVTIRGMPVHRVICIHKRSVSKGRWYLPLAVDEDQEEKTVLSQAHQLAYMDCVLSPEYQSWTAEKALKDNGPTLTVVEGGKIKNG